MSDTGAPPCGCCVGETRETPAPIWNRPGLARIAYRAGTHTSFKASLLSALTDPAYPELAPLTTREPTDFSIALLDAFAVAADILTFYQERLANEAYLRTAVQQRSVFELARLVGYQPAPGVSASAPLAFTLNDAKGAPDPVTIDAGTRVQSVPDPGDQPVMFETAGPLTARIAHNALPAVTTIPVDWTGITTSLWLAGTSTGLKVGDAIVFVDSARVASASGKWAFGLVTALQIDSVNGRSLVTWDNPLPSGFQQNATLVQVYALRKRGSLFGVNAPDPDLLPRQTATATSAATSLVKASITDTAKSVAITLPQLGDDWSFTYQDGSKQIDLDAIYQGITPGAATSADFAGAPERFAWIVLTDGGAPSLYRVMSVTDRSPRLYTQTFKVTSAILDDETGLAGFVAATRSTTAFVQSEPLAIADQPLLGGIDGLATGPGMLKPVTGASETVLGGGLLAVGQKIALIGKRARLQLTADASAVGADRRTPIAAANGDIFLIDAYPPITLASGNYAWTVLTTKGVPATLSASPGGVVLIPADQGDAEVSEAVVIADSGIQLYAARTALTFTTPLARIYDRSTARFNANVVDSSHGETVSEILGGADSSVANQSFALKQKPLTYVSAAEGQGAQSTLNVWVNDLRWQEQPGLLDAGPRDRSFVTRRKEDGSVVVQFGDGQHGARPPTGQTNVRAVYRKGLGAAGNVAAGQLSQAIDRPGGLRGVLNPAPGTGGADPDTPEDARQSAPLHVRTLERIVSLQDYEDYAQAFAGVGKALATWTWSGSRRGVVVTVAGAEGDTLDPNGDTIINLTTALIASGNPYVPVSVVPHRSVAFELGGLVRIDTVDYDPDLVLTAAREALTAAFSFDARSLGQGVTQSEVIAAIQGIAGVMGVRLTVFTREDSAQTLPDFLSAAAPQPGARGTVNGAELLLVDPLSLTQIASWQ